MLIGQSSYCKLATVESTSGRPSGNDTQAVAKCFSKLGEEMCESSGNRDPSWDDVGIESLKVGEQMSSTVPTEFDGV